MNDSDELKRKAHMNKIEPKEGQLFIVVKKGLFISGGSLAEDIDVELNSIVMYLGITSFAEALEMQGYDFTEIEEFERTWPAGEAFWTFLYEDHVIHLPVVDAVDFLDVPYSKKRRTAKALPPQDQE